MGLLEEILGEMYERPRVCDHCKQPFDGPGVISTQSTCCSETCSLAWALGQQRRYKWVESRVVKELPKEKAMNEKRYTVADLIPDSPDAAEHNSAVLKYLLGAGGTIELPPGVFHLLPKPIVIDKPNTTLEGSKEQ
jgi:hypothetical protein